jgi:hypothetical protein
MSAVEAQRRDLPETTVKNRSGYSERLHRQAPDADAPAPACCERERSGAEYREVSTSHYYPAFADLCQNPECFGEDGERELVGDGGQTECTDKLCDGVAEFACWMPDRGDFARVRNPERDDLSDGDLCPFLCESCRDRRAGSSLYDGFRFVRPEEKLVTDGAGLTTADLDVALSTTDLLLGADLNGVRIAVTAPRTTEAAAVADALAAARPVIHEGWQRSRSLQPPLSASAYEAIQDEARADGGLGALDRADELLASVVEDVEGEAVHRLIQVRQLLAVAQNGDGR